MTCDLALDQQRLPLPDMEAVYRIAAARVTLAVREGRIELALRWSRVLNLALRDRQMRARLPVTADEVRARMAETGEPVPEVHYVHPVFDASPEPESVAADSAHSDRRQTFREARRRE